MGIIAYAYEADIHCVGCAEARFGRDEKNGWVPLEACDREGNPVHGVFSTDELNRPMPCGTCRKEIV